MQNNIFEKKKQKTINYERKEKPKIGFHNLHTPISIVISNKIRTKHNLILVRVYGPQEGLKKYKRNALFVKKSRFFRHK